jgi:hypothetical protein
MSRRASACLVVGLLAWLGTAPGAAADGFTPVSRVAEGGSFASLSFRQPRPWHRPHHRYRHGRYSSVPLYLDRRGYGQTPVIIQQTIAPVTVFPAYAAVPSFNHLPVSAGIRDARPAEPAVYVLNDRVQSRFDRNRSGSRGSGPRIITLPDPDDEIVERETAFGARIIHLTVPAGPRS